MAAAAISPKLIVPWRDSAWIQASGAAGGLLVRHAVPEAALWSDLRGFEACLKALAAMRANV